MVISAQHFNEVTNGYEKTSSGLWTHKGRSAVGALQVTGPLNLSPPTGQGVEILYDPLIATGYVYSYDRDAQAWRDLWIQGKSVNVGVNSGGTLNLPAGSITSAAIADGAITTADIAPNAVTQLIGQYFAAPTFTSTSINTWLATPVSTGSIACSGARVRIVCTGTLNNTIVANVFAGLMIDAVATYSIVAATVAGANYSVPFCFEIYHVPAAGNHTYTLMVNSAGGTIGLSGVYHTLFATEEKR